LDWRSFLDTTEGIALTPAFRMNINVEHQPNCRAVAHIRVPGEEVTKQRNSIISYYAGQVRLPGFRPGKAPTAAVIKRYGPEIESELEKQLINDGLRTAIRNEGLEVLNILGINDKIVHEADKSFSFSAEISLAPKIELPEYKGIPVKLARIEVTEADVDHDLLHLRERYASFQDVDRGALMGDAVVLSFTGSLDGQPLAEALPEAPDHLKEMKENWFLLGAEEDFLPGYYAGLVGVQKDEERALSISLPEDYNLEGLRGKTISLAITASETGHLVLGTLHTGSAPRTLDRVLDVFPTDQRDQIRIMVSESLRGIISQQLVPRKDGNGRALAIELLVNTPAVANCIREGKTFMLPGIMQTGRAVGMVTMDDALKNLYRDLTRGHDLYRDDP
jgi:trigger factor